MTNSRSIQRLEDDGRKRYPGITIYDVGDEAHAKGTSGHNHDDKPGVKAEDQDADNKPEVRALDFMRGSKFSATQARDLFEALTRRPANQARLLYVIYNRRIRSRTDGWKDRPYSGENPHTDHVHASGRAEDDENTKAWELPGTVTPPKPPTPTPEVEAPMTVRFQAKTGPAQFLDNGRHITSSDTAKALQAAGVPLIQVKDDAELASLLPLPVVAAPIDVQALADALAARLPQSGLTQAEVAEALASVLTGGTNSVPTTDQ
jgi:hypothetical protein